MNGKITIDCEEIDAPDTIEWWCRVEKSIRSHKRKLRERYLIGYVCSSCYNVVHPVSLLCAGKIIEGKWQGVNGNPYDKIT